MDKGGVKATQAIMAKRRGSCRRTGRGIWWRRWTDPAREKVMGSGWRTHSGKGHMLSRWGGSRRSS
eukprot:5906173-Prymnesium_polylepis.1